MDFKPFLEELCELSAGVILPYFADPKLVVDTKADNTPVTAADRGAEAALRKRINERFPEHGIIGEEYGREREDAPYVWVLDPVDGTKSFAAHNAQFGTLICLLHEGKPVLGAINLPATRQRVVGDGKVTTLNGIPVKVREPRPLADSILVTTELQGPARYQQAAPWDALVRSVGKLYTWGDCYAYYLLCAGGVDIACDPAMNPWDLLPLIPIIEGAGGRITDWQGRPAAQGQSCIAAHPAIHEQVLTLLGTGSGA